MASKNNGSKIPSWIRKQYGEVLRRLDKQTAVTSVSSETTDEETSAPHCGRTGVRRERMAQLKYEQEMDYSCHSRRGCGDWRTSPRRLTARALRKL